MQLKAITAYLQKRTNLVIFSINRRYFWVFATNWTFRVLVNFDLIEPHSEGIIVDHAPYQRLSEMGNVLHHLCCLHSPDHPWKNAHNPSIPCSIS